MRRVLPLAFLPLVLSGCGGADPSFKQGSYALSPKLASVEANGTTVFDVEAVDAGYVTLDLSVKEGAAGGTVVRGGNGPDGPTALYAAPATPGTYHVRARFLNADGDALDTEVSTVVVTAAPSP